MKKKIIFIFFILVTVTLNCQAVEWKQPNIGEHPFKVNSNLIIPITDDVSKLIFIVQRFFAPVILSVSKGSLDIVLRMTMRS